MAWWVFVAVCGLSLVVVSRGYSLAVVCRLLITGASLAAEHRFYGTWASVVVALGLSCPTACILLDKGLNLCPLP